MSRELKFRVYWDEVEGVGPAHSLFYYEGEQYVSWDNGACEGLVSEIPVMQYTGLRDHTGAARSVLSINQINGLGGGERGIRTLDVFSSDSQCCRISRGYRRSLNRSAPLGNKVPHKTPHKARAPMPQHTTPPVCWFVRCISSLNPCNSNTFQPIHPSQLCAGLYNFGRVWRLI